jgi:hypothetical protein
MMLRLADVVLTLAPLAGLAILYFLVFRGSRVSSRWLVLAALVVLGLGGWLTWVGTSERLDRDQRYVPAQLHDGEVVQGHGE